MGITREEREAKVKACIKDLLPLLDEMALILYQHGMEKGTLDVQGMMHADFAETIEKEAYVTDVVLGDSVHMHYDWLRNEWRTC